MTMAFNEKTFVPTLETDWFRISRDEFLSEEFMERYSSQLNFIVVSKHQKISRSFILKYRERMNFHHLQFNRYLSQELRNEIKNWQSVMPSDRSYYFEFREKIEDRKNAI